MPQVRVIPHPRTPTTVCSLAATIVILACGVVGCDAEDPTAPPAHPPATSPATSAPPPSPTPTPTPSSQREQDEAAIKSAILDFRAMTERLSMNPDDEIDQLRSVAAGSLLETELNMYREWRAKGWRATKPVKVENLEVGVVRAGTATASYCANSTGVDVVDRNGTSQVVDGRPNFFPKLVQLKRTKAGAWIPTQQTTEGDACDTR